MCMYSFQFIFDTLIEIKLLITLHFPLRYHYTQEHKVNGLLHASGLFPQG